MNNLTRLAPDALQIVTTPCESPYFYKVNGDQINWVCVESKTGTTWSTNPTSHKWTQLFGMYTPADSTKYFTTTANGGYSNTMVSEIGTAYEQTGLVVGNIADPAFRASFAPNVQITIPITGGTGTLSGLTSVNLYSAFVEQGDSMTSTQSGPCSTWKVDSLCNEEHRLSTEMAGIGYAYDGINNPGPSTNGVYRSGVMHLFTDYIDWSGATTGTTWSTGWSGDSRYTFDGGKFAQFDGETRNKSVGVLFTDSGQIAIYDPMLVSAFNSGIAVSGNCTTGMTFNTSDCCMITKDKDVYTSLGITVTLMPGDFGDSQNRSKLTAKEAGIPCTDVDISELCFFNNAGEVMAVGLLDTVISKSESNFTIVTAEVSMDGGKRPPIYEAGNNTFYPT